MAAKTNDYCYACSLKKSVVEKTGRNWHFRRSNHDTDAHTIKGDFDTGHCDVKIFSRRILTEGVIHVGEMF